MILFVNLVLGSVLIFISSALLIELFIFLCHPAYRMRVFMRWIPLAKVCIDLFRYRLDWWATLQGINPLLAPENSRTLFAVVTPFPLPTFNLGFFMETGKSFTLVDWLILTAPTIALSLTVALVGVSLLRVIRLSVQFFQARREIRRICDEAEVSGSVKISDVVTQPCSMNQCILLPRDLVLEEKELEAVVAHERSHLRWKDSAFSVAEAFITTLFWFIPGIGWWRRRISLDRERACDRAAKNRFALATAILKCAPKSPYPYGMALAGSSLKRRITLLLQPKRQKSRWIGSILILFLGAAVLFGRLWIA